MSDPNLPQKTASLQDKKTIIVALAGNPNCGKTTIFNALTKMRQRVGNYPGVTVEKKIGKMVSDHDRVIHILDLPGTYSLAIRSPDEKVARDVLLGRMSDTPRPDLVICVVDASSLERSLYLVSQIQDLGLPVILNLNMMDTLEVQGQEIDIARLSQVLGVPVIPTVASQDKGIELLKAAIIRGVSTSYHRKWRMPQVMETEIEKIALLLSENSNLDRAAAFSEALLLISKDDLEDPDMQERHRIILDHLKNSRRILEENNINWRSAAIESRYAWIHDTLKEVTKERAVRRVTATDRLDTILTHRLWGWIFFVGLMAFMFFTIFSLAAYPMDWIDHAFASLTEALKSNLPAGDLRDLVTDGIIAGVGAVVIFLPQILILFFFIGFLQDTGYMARAAFIMDRLMTKVGLHGKSFIPLLSSFACAIPGVMAARTIESPKDRLVTILVAPLMSCSARIPVYTVLIATLIPEASAVKKAGLMLLMYFLGMVGAFLMAWLFKKTLLRSETPVFIMELPPYRLPSIKTVILHMWERSRLFLKRAGTVIFALSILLWAVMSYPKHEGLSSELALENSLAGMAGKALEPIIKPLGFDWRIGIGLIGSFAAREVFVSTMSIVFNVQDSTGSADSLQEAFRKATWPDGHFLFTPLVCLSIMVFYVFAMQCVSTIAIVYRETNSWRWAAFQVFYMTTMAYVLSFCVFQGGRLLGFQ